MRKIFFFLILFCPFHTIAQASWVAAFPVKTSFEIGESHEYEVSEFFKIDNLLFGSRYEITSTVSFRVVDTARGGYWIRYTVYTGSVKEHKDSSAYLMATLMNGINLFLYVKDGDLQLDSASYFNAKKKIAANLDSMITGKNFGKNTTGFIEYLQNELKDVAGLGTLLAPLGVFETYYSSGIYKKFKNEFDGNTENILNKPLFPGIIEKEWTGTSKDSTVTLNYLFTGSPVAAAQYHKAIYDPIFAAKNIKRGKFFYPPEMKYVSHHSFRTQPGKSFPSYLFKKTVSEYIFRSVLKLEMKEVTD